MVLTLQQKKFKIMLEEAITLLCRSSLPYKCEASIEALIGITVDCDDVFLISIKEKFDNKLPRVSSDISSEDDMYIENSLSDEEKDNSIDLQNDHSRTVLDMSESSEIMEPKSKKRKRDIDKQSRNNEGFHFTNENQNNYCDDVIIQNQQEPEHLNYIDSTNTNVPAEQNLSSFMCGEITEIKSERLTDNFLNDCFSVPDDSQRFRFTNAGCHVFSDYNSRINVRVEKFPMPKGTSDTKPPKLTSIQVAMANEILNISGSFVNIGSAKAFQHSLRVLSKSELSEVVNNMSLPPGNPHSVGVLCTEGVSRVFYKIPPLLIKPEALNFFHLDFYSYSNLYHSSVRVPHNIRDPEEWKALIAMKNPFSFPNDSSPIRT